jgi:hypothetical protein
VSPKKHKNANFGPCFRHKNKSDRKNELYHEQLKHELYHEQLKQTEEIFIKNLQIKVRSVLKMA